MNVLASTDESNDNKERRRRFPISIRSLMPINTCSGAVEVCKTRSTHLVDPTIRVSRQVGRGKLNAMDSCSMTHSYLILACWMDDLDIYSDLETKERAVEDHKKKYI